MKLKYLILLSITVTLFAFISFPHKIVGHWISFGSNNSRIYIEFNPDGSFKVSTEGETENEGLYTYHNDTISIYDKNCGMTIPGTYKVIFYNPDSASFSLIQDSCIDRATEVNGGVIKRVARE